MEKSQRKDLFKDNMDKPEISNYFNQSSIFEEHNNNRNFLTEELDPSKITHIVYEGEEKIIDEILKESVFKFHENEYQKIEYDSEEIEYSYFISFDKNPFKDGVILENYHNLIKFLNKIKEEIKDKQIDLILHFKKIPEKSNDNNSFFINCYYLLLNSKNYLDEKEYKDENIFNKEIYDGFDLFLKENKNFFNEKDVQNNIEAGSTIHQENNSKS